ncbi:MAG TPA: tail fiber domain-containing protein, partial [Bdellovibrio sp.]|nr:tail fiber domain-containing protein [Bdellovibrio sp.]
LPIARGGTNSTTALNNNRVMVSSAGSIVETAAITANRAIASNGSGLPVASATTDTELGYLSGVTSSIQTQLNGKASSSGWTNYSVMTSNSSGALQATPGTVNGSILQYSATGPAYSTASYPTSTSANQLLYSSSGNVVGGLATASNSVLVTNGSGVPAWSGVSGDLFSQYALLAGRSGGQTINGGTAASENLTLDSTANSSKGKILLAPNGGNVGLGTSNPTYNLDILSSNTGASGTSVNIQNNSTGPAYLLLNATTGWKGIVGVSGPTTEYMIGTLGGPDGAIQFFTNNGTALQERMRLTPDGSVGLGIATPQGLLDIERTQNNFSTNGLIVGITTPTTVNGTYYTTASQVQNSANIITGVTNSGTVAGALVTALRNNSSSSTDDSGTLSTLIGEKITFGHGYGNNAAYPITGNVFGLVLQPLAGYDGPGEITGDMYDLYLADQTNGALGDNIAGTHYGIYQANYGSNLFNGTTAFKSNVSMVSAVSALSVATTVASGTPSLVNDSGITASFRNQYNETMVGASTSAPYAFWMQSKASSQSGTAYPISLNPLGGNVGIGTNNPTANLHVAGSALATAWNVSSDIRLKENIKVISSPLEKLQNLHGVEFDWRKDVKAPTIHDQTHDVGVIAQEVEKVFPEAVTTPKDGGYKSVAYTKLIAPLIEAVKSLYEKWIAHDKEIAVLKEQNQKMDYQIKELSARLEKMEKEKSK